MRSCGGRETVALYTSAMPEPKLYAFSTHIAACATATQLRRSVCASRCWHAISQPET
jgi:hypothetical protein